LVVWLLANGGGSDLLLFANFRRLFRFVAELQHYRYDALFFQNQLRTTSTRSCRQYSFSHRNHRMHCVRGRGSSPESHLARTREWPNPNPKPKSNPKPNPNLNPNHNPNTLTLTLTRKTIPARCDSGLDPGEGMVGMREHNYG